MSSRILQETGDLLLTQSSEPIINDNFISAEGFVTSNTTISETSIVQEQLLSTADIVTGLPVFELTAIEQVHYITGISIVTGLPVFEPTAIEQVHYITGISIDAQRVLTTSPYYNAALARTVSLTANSSNKAVISESSNEVV